MLPPQLRQGQHRLCLTQSRASGSPRTIALPRVTTTIQTREWSWHQQARRFSWDSHTNPRYAYLQYRREQRHKAAVRKALERRYSWDVPRPNIRPGDLRFASNRSRNGRRYQIFEKEQDKTLDDTDNDKFTAGEKRWTQQKMKAFKDMKDYITDDPLRAVFGKSFDDISPRLWSPLLPAWATAVAHPDTGSTLQAESTPGNQTRSPYRQIPRAYSEASWSVLKSSRRPGQQPIVEVSSSSWNSASNVTKHSRYDPISGRMVSDKPAALGAFSTSAKLNVDSANIPVKKFGRDGKTARESSSKPFQSTENELDSLTAENVRAGMGRSKQSGQSSKQDKEESAQNTTSFSDLLTKITKNVPTIQSALERVNALKGKNSDPKSSTASPVNKVKGTPEIADQDGYPMKPMGMQTAFGKEINEAGSGSRQPLEEEIKSAQSNEETFSDGYPTDPRGMQTSFTKEQRNADGKSSFEQQLKGASTSHSTAESSYDDGYSQSPTGLQQVYETERQAAAKDKKSSFEQYLKESNDALRRAELAIEDEYPSTPSGMQTAYENERRAAAKDKRVSFERQLQEATDALHKAELAFDDEYSSSPVGMQTAYEKERQAAMKDRKTSIEEQLKDAEQAFLNGGAAIVDDYPSSPIGMQTAYEKERQAASVDKTASFEHQLREASNTLKNVEQTIHDDYSKSPIGMQTTFEAERRASLLGEKASFEHQLREHSVALNSVEQALDDGYSKSPLGLQKTFEKEREASLLDEKASIEHHLQETAVALKNIQDALDDGYSKSPIGLQTTYEKERESSSVDGTTSFEQQLKEASESLKKMHKSFDDEYPTTPIGLQMSYAREQEIADKNAKESFEQQLSEANKNILDAQKGLSGQYEDGYTNSHIGLETSYALEREACVKGEQKALEKELADADKPTKAYNDHYNASPIGLQMIYEQERDSSEKGHKPSLEEELAIKRSKAAGDMLRSEIENQKLAMHAHEGRYKHMIPSLVSRSNDSTSPTAPLSTKIMQGEGDVCSNVVDFVKNDRWYKQTNGDRQAMVTLQQQDKIVTRGEEATDVVEMEREMAAMKTSYSEQMEQKSRQVSDLIKQLKVAQDKRDKLNQKKVTWKGGKSKESLEMEYAASESDIMKLELQIKGARDAQDKLLDKSVKLEKAIRSKISQAKRESFTSVIVPRTKIADTKAGDDGLAAMVDTVCKDNKLYETDHSADLVDKKVEISLKDHDKVAQESYKFKNDSLEQDLQGHRLSTRSTQEPKTGLVEKQNQIAALTKSKASVSTIQWAEPALYKILAYDSGNDTVTVVTTPSTFTEDEGPLSISRALSQLYRPARFVPHFATLQSEGYQVISATKDLLVFRKIAQPPTAKQPTEEPLPEIIPDSTPPSPRAHINPIDGTQRPAFSIPTGNFASPTGFVNYDPVLTPEELSSYRSTSSASATETEPDTAASAQRVRRQEPVFSGSDRYYYRSEKGDRKDRRRAWRRRVRFALSVGGTSAALVYALGVGAEVARGDRKEKKREG